MMNRKTISATILSLMMMVTAVVTAASPAHAYPGQCANEAGIGYNPATGYLNPAPLTVTGWRTAYAEFSECAHGVTIDGRIFRSGAYIAAPGVVACIPSAPCEARADTGMNPRRNCGIYAGLTFDTNDGYLYIAGMPNSVWFARYQAYQWCRTGQVVTFTYEDGSAYARGVGWICISEAVCND